MSEPKAGQPQSEMTGLGDVERAKISSGPRLVLAMRKCSIGFRNLVRILLDDPGWHSGTHFYTV